MMGAWWGVQGANLDYLHFLGLRGKSDLSLGQPSCLAEWGAPPKTEDSLPHPPFPLSPSSRAGSSSAIQGAAALVLAAEWEGRLALGLGHLAGQVDERLQQGAAVSH